MIAVALASIAVAFVAIALRRPVPSPHRNPVVRSQESSTLGAGTLTLPNRATSVKFAVIGDSGRGTPPQYEIAARMLEYHARFKYPFVVMLGDNIYEGPATAEDYREKFEEPYAELLRAGIKFYAALGNHDDPRQVDYAPFNMRGKRYYSFGPPEDLLTKLTTRVEFFALDSTNLDRTQIAWLDSKLGESHAEWKLCLFHHPLYTSGRYRFTARTLRLRLEPLLVRHDVDVVLAGHEHIYQRSTIQSGIQHFTSGGAGSLRPGDGAPAPFIARTFASDYHFLLIEIDDRELHFQAISRSGQTIDAGVLFKDSDAAGEAAIDVTTRKGTPRLQ
jgi:hypothetical protein